MVEDVKFLFLVSCLQLRETNGNPAEIILLIMDRICNERGLTGTDFANVEHPWFKQPPEAPLMES